MKKFFIVFLTIILVIVTLLVGCTEKPSNEGNDPEPNPPSVQTYSITYYAVVDGVKVSDSQTLLEKLKDTNKSYPTEYEKGKAIEIDNLINREIEDDLYYNFKGYFVDIQCQEEFGGITDQTEGDIIIYVKLTTSQYGPSFT